MPPSGESRQENWPTLRRMLTARFTPQRPSLDGKLDSAPWQSAEVSPLFVDMATGRPAHYETRTAALWDDENLYIGFWVQEPYPEARLTERDSLIFQEKDVELFIDGGDCYYEFEINALGTIYEMFFVWRDAFGPGSRFEAAGLDRTADNAYTFGGDYDRKPETFWEGSHPRGTRWAFRRWHMPGLVTAAWVDGELNSDTPGKGWRVEMAIPWTSLKLIGGDRPCPPQASDVWRMFFGRFQKVNLGGEDHQAAWCLTPHGRYDTHMPEEFTEVRFER